MNILKINTIARVALLIILMSKIGYSLSQDTHGTIPKSGCVNGTVAPTGYTQLGGDYRTECYRFPEGGPFIIEFRNFLSGAKYLEVYSVLRETLIFARRNITQKELPPPIVLNGPAYLYVQFNSLTLGVIIEPFEKSQFSKVTSYQAALNSTGYPTSYYWSDSSETHLLDAKNKEVILSVDLDLRDGEIMTVESVTDEAPIVSFSDTRLEDIYLKDQAVNLTIRRSFSKDFRPHRGYKLIMTEFQKVIQVEANNISDVTTPGNLTSLLLRIVAAPDYRISYNITAPSAGANYEMRVIDSQSLFGRPVDAEERFSGSTTSNHLLVSLRSSKEVTFLPKLTVSYASIPCDNSHDHVCDSKFSVNRCVPADKLCRGIPYCMDGSDLEAACPTHPVIKSRIISTSSYQRTITSPGYPTSYHWSYALEMYPIDVSNNDFILSVADLDLRDGEKVIIQLDGITIRELTGDYYLYWDRLFQLDPMKSYVSIHHSVSSDSKFHRGYKLAITEFQKVIRIRYEEQITTPKNLTSLLVMLLPGPNLRVMYNISVPITEANYDMQVVDSTSLMGQPVDEANRFSGLTNSTGLMISLRSTKEGVFVPVITIDYQTKLVENPDWGCIG